MTLTHQKNHFLPNEPKTEIRQKPVHEPIKHLLPLGQRSVFQQQVGFALNKKRLYGEVCGDFGDRGWKVLQVR